MANRRVRSGAAGAANGTTWADAYLTIGAAVTASTNADTIWVADDHAEVFVADTTWTCPTTPGLRILCVDTHTTDPPTGLSVRTAIVSTTTTGADLFVNGFVYVYGLQMNVGDSGDQMIVAFGNANNLNHGQVWEECGVTFGATSASGAINLALGPQGTNITIRSEIALINFVEKHVAAPGAAGGCINFRNGRIHINGLTLAASALGPTTGYFSTTVVGRGSGNILIENFDLSVLGSTTAILNVAGVADWNILIRNGKITASAPLTGGSHPGASGSIVRFENVDSGDTNYRFAHVHWHGTVLSETTITMVGGTNPSQVMTCSQDLSQHPLPSLEMAVWIPAASIGNTVTVTVPILRDNATNLQDDEVWLVGSGPDVSGSPKRTRKSSRMAPIATAADLTSSGETWNQSMSNPNEQEVSFSFTAQEEGYVNCRVMLAKNTTIYVNGAPVLS